MSSSINLQPIVYSCAENILGGARNANEPVVGIAFGFRDAQQVAGDGLVERVNSDPRQPDPQEADIAPGNLLATVLFGYLQESFQAEIEMGFLV